MKTKGAAYFLVFVLLVVAYAVAVSLTYSYLEDRLLLVLAGGVILTLGVIQLTRELRAKGSAPKEVKADAADTIGTGPERRRIFSTLGWVGGFLLGIYLLGFIIGGALLVVAYLKLNGYRWLKAVGYAVIISVAMYGMFRVGLRVQLYPGLFFPGFYM